MTRKRVIKAHEASYADPIKVFQGEDVILSEKTDDWNGYIWIWATDRRNKSGWVPDDLVSGAIAIRDYHAIELTCRKGALLVQLGATHGWGWCQNEQGKKGWVPLDNLSPD